MEPWQDVETVFLILTVVNLQPHCSILWLPQHCAFGSCSSLAVMHGGWQGARATGCLCSPPATPDEWLGFLEVSMRQLLPCAL